MSDDPRLLSSGLDIPTETYSDQPFVVQTDDGAWLCAVTTGAGHEGQSGQYVCTQRSLDRGVTWQDRVAVESPTGPEASYAVMLKTPSGRVYVFYNYNTQNQREVIADPDTFKDGLCRRVDSLGDYVCKYSDDHGRTWSRQRWVVPMRLFAIDRQNPYGGEVRFGWNVGKPFVIDGAVYLSFHKVGGFGRGFFTSSEGVLVRSDNLLTERDPERFVWETLPDGEIGLRTPPGGGPVSEEHSYVTLSDDTIYCVYRTTDGHPVCARSYDRGHTWTTPAWQCFGDGRRMKHPRAANFIWKCRNGKYLYWFHNHGGSCYEDRNPAWLCGGVEVDGPDGRTIAWSQPEIVLYDDDTHIRMSYPDLIEMDDQLYITETQKDTARVHAIDPALLAGLWGQFDEHTPAPTGAVLELPGTTAMPERCEWPRLPEFAVRDGRRADFGTRPTRQGFSIDLTVQLAGATTTRAVLLDSRTPDGAGVCVAADRSRLEVSISDGRTENVWRSDAGALRADTRHRLTVVVDGGPHIILVVIDGLLYTGGAFKQFGWARFSPCLMHVHGEARASLACSDHAVVSALGVYARALRVSEAVALQCTPGGA